MSLTLIALAFTLVAIGDVKENSEGKFQSIVTFQAHRQFHQMCHIDRHPGVIRFEVSRSLLKITLISKSREYFYEPAHICLKAKGDLAEGEFHKLKFSEKK